MPAPWVRADPPSQGDFARYTASMALALGRISEAFHSIDWGTIQAALEQLVLQVTREFAARLNRGIDPLSLRVTRLDVRREWGYDGERRRMPVNWEIAGRRPADPIEITNGSGAVFQLANSQPVWLTGEGEAWVTAFTSNSSAATVTYTSTTTSIDWSTVDAAPMLNYYLGRPYEWGGRVAPNEYRGVFTATPPAPPRELTDAERAEQEARRATRERQIEEFRRDREERERVRVAAEERARELLRSLLSPEQLEALDTRNEIPVTGSCGTRFVLNPNHTDGNVAWSRGEGPDRESGQICCHPRQSDADHQYIPLDDVIAGQVLALQCDEETFVRTANLYEGDRPTYPYQAPADPPSEEQRQPGPGEIIAA